MSSKRIAEAQASRDKAPSINPRPIATSPSLFDILINSRIVGFCAIAIKMPEKIPFESKRNDAAVQLGLKSLAKPS